jgi:peptide/nickel transport system permease protein
MRRQIALRVLGLGGVLAAVSLVVFGLMALVPGDPAQVILGPYATAENLEKLRAEMALDRPWPERYARWLGNLLRGDLGESTSLNRPVREVLIERFPPTLLLAGTALLLCSLAGLAAGSWAALRHNTWTDRVISLVVLAGLSVPSFALGLLFIALFAIGLGWLPAGGMLPVTGEGGVVVRLQHLLLPAVTLALVAAGIVARLMRTSVLEVQRQDFVRTARAKGLGERRILIGHVLRNALVTMVPVLALQAGFVIGGAVYIETVFQWPGLGSLLVQAIRARDLLLVQGAVLVLATAYVVFNLAADLVQVWLDPRLRE